MKVLQINSVCGIGSIGRIAVDIHHLLKSHGDQSLIAYGRGVAFNCDSAFKVGNSIDVFFHGIKTRLLDKHGLGSYLCSLFLIHKIKKINPDVIHLHNIHGYYINYPLLFRYLKKSRKPVIWTLHDCWPFTGHCAYFDFIQCHRWKTNCYSCPLSLDYPKALIDKSKSNFFLKKNTFTGVDNLRIVVPSRWLKGLVEQSFLREYQVSVINNGINLEIFSPDPNESFISRFSFSNMFIILGVASGFTVRKGYDYFMELSKHLKENEKIIMVGLNEKQIAYLPANIIGIKKTNDIHELADLYRSADVFVNLTLEDNFPTTNIEALACGTPVITFDSGGSAEAIDIETGFVVNKGDMKGLLSAISKIKQNKKSFYVKKCRKRALAFFDSTDRFNEYIDLYRALCE